MKAHCWVVLDGETVLNPPDKEMIPILVHRTATAAAAAATPPIRLAAASFD